MRLGLSFMGCVVVGEPDRRAEKLMRGWLGEEALAGGEADADAEAEAEAATEGSQPC